MTRILLDTSAYSALMRGHKSVTEALQLVDEIRLNVIILGELQAGFARGQQAGRNMDLLRRFLATPRVGILDLNEATAELYAVIHRALRTGGTPIPTNDVWIAASAMQFGLRILTLDKHFESVPQVVVHRLDV